MKVFISWSGERSRVVAQALHEWLSLVLHYVEPWFSNTDIAAGERWAVQLAQNLEQSSFGLICLTRENVKSSWLLFEAGALSKSFSEGAVVPLLFRLELSELSGPLTQFQAKKTDKESLLEVVQAINSKAEVRIENTQLLELFNLTWPKLEKDLGQIPVDEEEEAPIRSSPEILEELVGTVRSIDFRLLELESLQREKRTGDRDVVQMEAIMELVTRAKALVAESEENPNQLSEALILCDQCARQIRSLFTTRILSDEARQYARDLLAQADALRQFCREKLEQ